MGPKAQKWRLGSYESVLDFTRPCCKITLKVIVNARFAAGACLKKKDAKSPLVERQNPAKVERVKAAASGVEERA